MPKKKSGKMKVDRNSSTERKRIISVELSGDFDDYYSVRVGQTVESILFSYMDEYYCIEHRLLDLAFSL